MATRIGIDTGGTFTDVVVRLGRGSRTRLEVFKVPSTPNAPARAVLDGLARTGVPNAEVDLVHGTTVALNAMLTGRVARTAFVTNEGFRDLIEIGRQERLGLYELEPRKATPPVPRELRFEIASRRDADGNTIAAPSRAALAKLRAAIEAAGGWRDLTITEDLDLSYRAQLAGWRFVYLDDLETPAELPESWLAFRAQQARWVRGSVETARLLLGPVLRADLPLGRRLDASVHLLQNFAYVFMAALATLLPAAVILREELGWRVPGGRPLLSALDFTMLGVGTCAMLVFYGVGAWRTDRRAGVGRGLEIAYALCIGAGMSLTNSAEVVAGLFSRRSEFVRTPKRGGATSSTANGLYRSRVRIGRPLIELIYVAYFGVAIAYAVRWSLFGALPFLLMYALGFFVVSVQSVRESLRPVSPADRVGSRTDSATVSS